MKLHNLFLSLCAITSLMLFGACQQTPEESVNNGETTLTFETTDIELDGRGGTFSLSYTIANGIEGIDIATKSDSEWLTNLHTENGKLLFDYTQNLDSEVRVATIMVTYPNVKSVMLKVKQRINDSITFELELTSATSTTCSTTITPSDTEAVYIAYMSEIDYLLSAQIITVEDLFLDDYNYFMGFANEFDAPLLKEFLLANYCAYQDKVEIDWTNMMPNKEYVLYVYAIEFNEENSDYFLASPVTYQIITLSGPELTTVEFDVDIDVNGPVAEYHINPNAWEGKYYLTVYKEGDYMYRDINHPADEDYSKLVSDTWLNSISQLIVSGYNTDQLMELMCLDGIVEYSETLSGDTNYAMVIYAIDSVDNLPQVISVPQIINFRTEAIGASDMTFEIKVDNKYVRVADITITPTTNEPYTAAIIAKSDIPDLENSEIIAWLGETIDLDTYHGEIKNHINNFQPETEYSILVFGYFGDVVTTDLFRYDFKMDAESECENSVLRVDFNAPYSLRELEAYNSDYYYNYGMFEDMGWYAMWAEIFTEVPTKDLFYCIYRADEFNQYGEQGIFADLVSYTCNYTQSLTGENNVLYVMCAVCMDYRGNYSDMWISEPFRYTYDDSTKRPIEEYIEKIHGSATPAAKRKSAANANLLIK